MYNYFTYDMKRFLIFNMNNWIRDKSNVILCEIRDRKEVGFVEVYSLQGSSLEVDTYMRCVNILRVS